jgi:hypothetical protein
MCEIIAQSASPLDYSKVELGYTATFLLGDVGARKLIFSRRGESDTNDVTGSNFIGGQSTISARMNFELGANKKFIVPIGADITFFRGLQRLEDVDLSGHGAVSSNLYSIVMGLQYKAVNLPLADAIMYGGVEMRGNFVSGANFEYEVVRKDSGGVLPKFSKDTTLKQDVFRFGAAARIGVQGVLIKPLIVNISFAYGVLNLFGVDKRTVTRERGGELLTPTQIGETSEKTVQFAHFSLWLQYRL